MSLIDDIRVTREKYARAGGRLPCSCSIPTRNVRTIAEEIDELGPHRSLPSPQVMSRQDRIRHTMDLIMNGQCFLYGMKLVVDDRLDGAAGVYRDE